MGLRVGLGILQLALGNADEREGALVIARIELLLRVCEHSARH
jgi:hypothetical protein